MNHGPPGPCLQSLALRALTLLLTFALSCAPSAATSPRSADPTPTRAAQTSLASVAHTASPAGATGPPPPAVPRSTVPAPPELFDAHIHYSSDAWGLYAPERAIEILRAAGIRHALVSSTPDTGTQRLYAPAPDLVVPMLRPYRTRDDTAAWTCDGTVVAHVESTYRRGVHRGIGEFHLLPGEALTPVVRAIVALAVRENL